MLIEKIIIILTKYIGNIKNIKIKLKLVVVVVLVVVPQSPGLLGWWCRVAAVADVVVPRSPELL
jgi:hypothetical protein